VDLALLGRSYCRVPASQGGFGGSLGRLKRYYRGRNPAQTGKSGVFPITRVVGRFIGRYVGKRGWPSPAPIPKAGSKGRLRGHPQNLLPGGLRSGGTRPPGGSRQPSLCPGPSNGRYLLRFIGFQAPNRAFKGKISGVFPRRRRSTFPHDLSRFAVTLQSGNKRISNQHVVQSGRAVAHPPPEPPANWPGRLADSLDFGLCTGSPL
jgi:hypothetical protein